MKTTFRGADGVVHRVADLPVKRRGMRWSYLQKAMVLGAVRSGALTEADAGARYDLLPDELREWGVAFDAHGLDGLKITKRAPNGSRIDRRRGVSRTAFGKGAVL